MIQRFHVCSQMNCSTLIAAIGTASARSVRGPSEISRTPWAAAIVHTGVDGFKVVNVSDDARLTFSLTLSAISIAVPLLALAARPKPEHPKPRQENGK